MGSWVTSQAGAPQDWTAEYGFVYSLALVLPVTQSVIYLPSVCLPWSLRSVKENKRRTITYNSQGQLVVLN